MTRRVPSGGGGAAGVAPWSCGRCSSRNVTSIRPRGGLEVTSYDGAFYDGLVVWGGAG